MFDTEREAARLTADLEAALLRQLMAHWSELNWSTFKNALRAPTVALVEAEGRLGRWVVATRTIEISRKLAVEQPWGVVIEVLKHEMAHQYVHEVLRQFDESAHGPVFRQVCQGLGIDAAATGMPDGAAATPEEQRVLQRIARLLALAESPNLHEAELAMNEAQRLMLKYNLEVTPTLRRQGHGFRHLGQPSGRIYESERLLAMILGKHFFVEVIWVPSYAPLLGQKGRVLEICGAPANLEMSAYVYDFLRQTAERLWLEHRRQRRLRSNRDRQTFLAGVMLGFEEKLSLQAVANRAEGLVWQGDAELRRFFRRRHPHVRYTRYGGNQRNEAHDEGRAAGRQIVLNRPVGGQGGSRGHLLPGRS